MELHPDRNYGNVEETTRLFAEVQSAHAVLSDPHERAWYDSHRTAILRDEAEPCEERFEHDLRVTTTEDILRMFAKFDNRNDFSDSDSGFYSILRGTFDTLAREEELTREWQGLESVKYSSFGRADDDFELTVKPFYADWSGFTTSKSFSWKNRYRLFDAPDRRVRRMMERENKRFREEGIHEFNDSVRSLVAFVRKRDPRYKSNFQSEADRQQSLRDAAAAQASRSRAANQAKSDNYKIPEWMKLDRPSEADISDNQQDPIEEQLECIVCKKTFKSEKQYEAHEKSKKHIKAVQRIRREIQNEDKVLNLHDQVGQNHGATHLVMNQTSIDSEPVDVDPGGVHYIDRAFQDLPNHNLVFEKPSRLPHDLSQLEEDAPLSLRTLIGKTVGNCSSSSSEGNEYALRQVSKADTDIEVNVASQKPQSLSPIECLSRRPSAESLVGGPGLYTKLKVGKAKEKRAKKAAQSNATIVIPTKVCNQVLYPILEVSKSLF